MIKKILSLVLLVLALVFVPTSFAQDLISPKSPTKIVVLSKDEIYDKDYFASGEIVEIAGTVNGDVFVAGGQVTISGLVNGDVFVAGGTIDITGQITQDIRIVGGQVTISGEIEGNATIGGGNVTLTDSASIDGSIIIGAGNVNVSSPIGKEALVGAGALTIANSIGGDLRAGVGLLRLSPSAAISGNLSYWSDEEALIDEDSTVIGEISHKEIPVFLQNNQEIKNNDVAGLAFGASLITKFISTLSLFVVGLVFAKLYPIFMKKTSRTIKEKPLASLGVGFVAVTLTPIISIIFLATILGIPIGLMLFALYFIYLYLAKVIAIFWAGYTLFGKSHSRKSAPWFYAGGILIYLVLVLIPIIGGFIGFFATLFGLGAFLITAKSTYKASRAEKIV